MWGLPHLWTMTLTVINGGKGDLVVDAYAELDKELSDIDTKAEHLIEVTAQVIRTQAAIQKGRALIAFREKYKGTDVLGIGWSSWAAKKSKSNKHTVAVWMNAAKMADQLAEHLEQETILNLSHRYMGLAYPCIPVATCLELINNNEFKRGSIERLRADPAVQLTKAKEELKGSTERLLYSESRYRESGQKKSDGTLTAEWNSYRSASSAHKTLLTKIAKLEEEVAKQKQHTSLARDVAREQASENSKLQVELQLAKASPPTLPPTDLPQDRERRIKRVSDSLELDLPIILNDLRRFYAEKEHYSTKVCSIVDQTIKELQSLHGSL
jgi:hypothetical protein